MLKEAKDDGRRRQRDRGGQVPKVRSHAGKDLGHEYVSFCSSVVREGNRRRRLKTKPCLIINNHRWFPPTFVKIGNVTLRQRVLNCQLLGKPEAVKIEPLGK